MYPVTVTLNEHDQDRRTYIEDVFDGSTDKVTPWKSLSSFSGTINLNAADNRLLDSMKRVLTPCLRSASHLVQKPVESLTAADFASVYLNRDWYLSDYINDRIGNTDEPVTAMEIFQMQRVWMLQCVYGTTASNLFKGASNCYSPVRRLEISYERYSFLFRKLGADLPEITINLVLHNDEQDAAAEVRKNQLSPIGTKCK